MILLHVVSEENLKYQMKSNFGLLNVSYFTSDNFAIHKTDVVNYIEQYITQVNFVLFVNNGKLIQFILPKITNFMIIFITYFFYQI